MPQPTTNRLQPPSGRTHQASSIEPCRIPRQCKSEVTVSARRQENSTLWLSTARVTRLHSVGIKTTSACSDTATPGLGRDAHTQHRHVGLDASAGGQVPAG